MPLSTQNSTKIKQAAVRYRLYPNIRQKQWLLRNFGCCRKVYNEALTWYNLAYAADGTGLSYNDVAGALPALKKFYPWLRDADSASLQQALRHLDTARKNFFEKRSSYPKYKTRNARQSYTTPMNGGSIKITDHSVILPKVKEIHAVIHRELPDGSVIGSATVSMEKDGSFYCSVQYSVPVMSDMPACIDTDRSLGLDYKLDGLYADSEGNIADMPHYYRKAERKLARAQRRIARKKGSRKGEKKSSNFQKQQKYIAKIQRHTANQRKDFLDKKSHALAEAYSLIAVEDLNMKAIGKKRTGRGFHFGKSTADNGYGMFLRMLDYKLRAGGGVLVRVDRFFPSSQLCRCGYKNPITKDLSIRIVRCPACGKIYDRDINAAINIRNEGIRIFLNGKTAA